MEPGTAPPCRRCQHRHLPGLPCWGGRYVAQVRALVLATYGDGCVHCGGPGARSIEHVHPRSMGGTDALSNLRPAHLACNMARGTQPMPGWGTGPVTAETSGRW
jgi:5-methylcytosine-specific restriction endonuclease McrA